MSVADRGLRGRLTSACGRFTCTLKRVTLNVPPDLFEYQDYPYCATPEHFLLITENPASALKALGHALERMWLTDEAGVEHPDAESAYSGGVYAPPSEVVGPDVTAAGILCSVDCQSAITSEQAAVFRDILRDELQRGGVSGTVRNLWGDEANALMDS
jgi:hypothetical protein